ncbi:hypothetical protein [Acidianus ambivalens]|uniref:Uncharacterized protein n=1 Tax=Acidianus ambivalens TaxID=2283 RepID=A0A650CS36_ACIAM|nr:hypothetical protein [Acidianus ambivalens]MQL55063.1 hypothetical protein [Acidianus ambivalens]QGR20618.1 hypothetical protein D1866_00240 [Acidianus ambivalens]
MKIKIWKEWYDILLKLSKDKRTTLEELIKEIMSTNDCINLPRVNTTRKKEINLNLNYTEKEVLERIEKFLFCD